MKPEYERAALKITEFDKKDVIATSGEPLPAVTTFVKENAYRSIKDFDVPGNWF